MKREARSAALVLSSLIVMHDEEGCLEIVMRYSSRLQPLMKAISNYLNIPPIWVYEIGTFYDMIERKPVGRYKISICTNLSCRLCGAEKIVDHFKKRLNINLGETTPDHLVTLKGVECLAACANAPMCQINDEDYHLNLTPEKIDDMLREMGVEVTENA